MYVCIFVMYVGKIDFEVLIVPVRVDFGVY